MKLGIMQPYFMPYLGYWQLMAAVDKYVVYDDVNYIKGGWINRNNILLNGQKKLFTITQSGASPNKFINEVSFSDDFVRFRKMLQNAYSKAPYFIETMVLLEQVFSYENRSLGAFMLNSFQLVAKHLDMYTEFILSSNIEKENVLKGKDKVLHICELLNATEYYNAIGGQKLYNKDEFAHHGIRLRFLQSKLQPYPQFKNDFVPGLSIIDVLMFNGKEAIQKLLGQYTLI